MQATGEKWIQTISHVENDFAVTVMTKWKLGLTILPNLTMYIF